MPTGAFPAAGAFALAVGMTAAATSQTASASTVEEIVVTARRVEERLQRVPVAVTAVTAEQLSFLQADTLGRVQGLAPNVNLVPAIGTGNFAVATIRGIGQPDILATYDPGVAIYVGDVYLARSQGALIDLVDVERVEVLRGPQGTLFGKNAAGGAIRVVPRRPSEEPSAMAEATLGSLQQRTVKARVGGGLVPNRLSASVAALYTTREGAATDRQTGQSMGDREVWGGRLSLLAAPAERLSVMLDADISVERGTVGLGRQEAPLTDLFGTVLAPGPAGPYDRDAQASSLTDRGNDLDVWGVALTAEYALSDGITAKSISAFRALDSDAVFDSDSTVFRISDAALPVAQDQLSQELQLIYDGSGGVTALAGLYWLREDLRSGFDADGADFLAPLGFGPYAASVRSHQILNSLAGYAQAAVPLAARWSVIGGLRYTWEEKQFDHFVLQTLSGFPVPPAPGAPNPFAFAETEIFTNLAPRLGLEFQATDAVLAYVSGARGFRSGGFNGRALSPGDTNAFDQETGWTVESGVKGDYFNSRLRLNLAAFYTDYDDFQAQAGGVQALTFPVINVPGLRVSGVEAEATATPMDGLVLSGNLGFLDAAYKDADGLRFPNGTLIEENLPAYSPRWSGRIAAAYSVPLSRALDLRVGADGQYQGRQALSVQNQPGLLQDPYWLFNARVGVAGESWQLLAGVRNLTDRTYKTSTTELSSTGNTQSAGYGDPRTWQVTLTVRY